MNLGDHIPSDQREITEPKITGTLWLTVFAFGMLIAVLVLLHRLGLTQNVILGITAIWLIITILNLAWLSRTMTSSLFFFANKLPGSPAIGLAGTTDWLSGAFLLVFFSSALFDQLILAPALVVGIMVQSVLFSVIVQRSGVATLPGFFAWRCGSQTTGYMALLVVALILGLLAVAEFRISLGLAQILTPLPQNYLVWAVLIIAIIPGIFGGWLGIILANASMAMWILVSALLPALVTGFAPNLLHSSLELDLPTNQLQPLEFAAANQLLSPDLNHSALYILLTLFILAAGFSVLPHALSRLSTNGRSVEAMESLGWSALIVFLLFSALPISIGLIGVSPSSPKLAVLLESHPVLNMLPYLAFQFAALNGLIVTLFATSSALVRALQRYRRLDPGEQSIFSTRLLIIIFALGIGLFESEIDRATDWFFFTAIVLGAGGLFVPLAASIWVSNLHSSGITLSVLAGASITLYCLSPWSALILQNHPIAGALGLIGSAAILALYKLIWFLLKKQINDEKLEFVRNPDPGA